MSPLRIRSLWRATACAALLAFAALPHGHLRGHEEVAAAWTAAHGEHTVSAVPVEADSGRHARCPLCLSLAQVRTVLVHDAAVPLPVLTEASRLLPVTAPVLAGSSGSARSAPRAPPLV